jgi:hypothetical protein
MLVVVVDQTTQGRFAAGQLSLICQGLTEHFCQQVADNLNLPAWQMQFSSDGSVPDGARVMLMMDNSDVPGAAGYHDENAQGIPESKIFVEDCLAAGYSVNDGPNSVSTVMDHEFKEMAFDEITTEWYDTGNGYQIAAEVCDPVENQGDAHVLRGQKVWCSDFVYLSYFDANSLGTATYNWLGGITAPFTILPGGYSIQQTSSGDVHAVYGEKFPEFKKAWKEREGSHLWRRQQKKSKIKAKAPTPPPYRPDEDDADTGDGDK